MVNGWAPKTEKMNAAMNEDMRTSATPYCCVVSIKSREKAMPGNTLQMLHELEHASSLGEYSLGEENESSSGDHTVIPCIRPVTSIEGSAGSYI